MRYFINGSLVIVTNTENYITKSIPVKASKVGNNDFILFSRFELLYENSIFSINYIIIVVILTRFFCVLILTSYLVNVDIIS